MPEKAGHQVKTCTCGTLFVYRKHHKTGNPAPICLDPDPKGNIVLDGDGTYRNLLKGETTDGLRYLNHFANCASRDRFGSKKP